ncbi:MAG TPA: DUF429 domain-containing protein [Longimicrobiaceae bacterium]|nr:DUF429 domain-containing protein [Longimicrobiaceae bacterium]
MNARTVVGIDLSGPASEQNTAVVSAVLHGERLRGVRQHPGTDLAIRDLVRSLMERSEVIVAIDAPLSYQPGGGQRARDAELRGELIAAGLRSGSVMAPTFHRMAWLTLRGMGLARTLTGLGCSVVEVHPGGCLALRGAPVDDVRGYSRDPECRSRLAAWLAARGFSEVLDGEPCSSHLVAACAAVLAARGWSGGNTVWQAAAEPPWHPFDFVC